MRLILRWKDVLTKLSSPLVNELTQMVDRINAWAKVEHSGDGTHGDISVTGLNFKGTTQTTVGAAGAASAIPGAPEGWAVISVNGTEKVIPYWPKE